MFIQSFEIFFLGSMPIPTLTPQFHPISSTPNNHYSQVSYPPQFAASTPSSHHTSATYLQLPPPLAMHYSHGVQGSTIQEYQHLRYLILSFI